MEMNIAIDQIEKLYQPGLSRHWFDSDTMRFFRTRLPQGGYCTEDGRYTFFVTSEQPLRGSRGYTVRVLIAPEDATTSPSHPTPKPHEIETVEPFNALTRSTAVRRAADLAAGKLWLVYEDFKWQAVKA